MQERIITRKEKARISKEDFPEHLSLRRSRRDPILFIPGFFRFYLLSAAIRRRLRSLDFEVYSVRLPNFAAGDIRGGARILLERVEEVRALLGVRRLSLIGQGLGGLVARCMAEQLGGADYLSRLVMLGTPNHGSVSFYPLFLCKGARQMLPGSSFLSNLNSTYSRILKESADLNYASVYTPYDLFVVPWINCRLQGAYNLRMGWFCTHMGLVRSRAVLKLLVELLEGDITGGEGAEEEDALLKELSQSLEDDLQDEGDLYRRAMLLMERGYYGWAIKDLTRLIKMRQDLPEAYLLRGKALRRKISYDENPIYNRAIRDFNQVIKLKPGWAEAYYQRGVCYALLNSWSDAVDNWDRSLILNRDFYQSYLARGIGRKRRGDIAGAVEDFREVLRIQPDEPEALRFLSELA
ncbi:MAG: tetratricopeptide repeat protein [Actinomycetota bacterium]|nr:tetratricopeptide repeat protein [Actinomycetota bacterium]